MMTFNKRYKTYKYITSVKIYYGKTEEGEETPPLDRLIRKNRLDQGQICFIPDRSANLTSWLQ